MNPAPEWRWIPLDVVYAIHDRQIAEHGGGAGVRDAALIDSALARPQNLAVYGEPDAAELAASYAFRIAKNHGFVDGNKRMAWVLLRLFLADNGFRFAAAPADAIRTMERLAAGQIDEASLAAWIRERITPPQVG